MTDIEFSKIDIESLFYTDGDYYLYECYKGQRLVHKSKFKHKDIFLALIPSKYVNEFDKNSSLVVQDDILTYFFKKVGNP